MKANQSQNSMEIRFQHIQKLGEGSYGQVHKVFDLHKQQLVALKKIKLNSEDEGIPSTTLREISLLRELNHTNIIQLTDLMYQYNERKLYLIFECMDTDLYQYTRNRRLNVEEIRFIFRQIIEAVDYCHENLVFHRDLKPQNILIDNSGKIVKIADFGLARHFSLPFRLYSKEIVTLWYRAPEILMGAKDYGIGVDIWSLGCIFAQLFFGRPIFQGECQVEQLFAIFHLLGTPTEESWPGIRSVPDFCDKFPQFPRRGFNQFIGFNDFDATALDLLEKMCELNPVRRIGCREILKHPFFENKRF